MVSQKTKIMVAKEKRISQVWRILESIYDPEIPVVSIVDLGIVRSVNILPETNFIHISITPTYSACPAIDAITMQIKLCMYENNFTNFIVEQVLSPAWTTNWISENGKQQMFAYGIAPPKERQQFLNDNFNNIACPQCTSTDTILVSQFSSTACKALLKCNNCLEPFDYFKCH